MISRTSDAATPVGPTADVRADFARRAVERLFRSSSAALVQRIDDVSSAGGVRYDDHDVFSTTAPMSGLDFVVRVGKAQATPERVAADLSRAMQFHLEKRLTVRPAREFAAQGTFGQPLVVDEDNGLHATVWLAAKGSPASLEQVASTAARLQHELTTEAARRGAYPSYVDRLRDRLDAAHVRAARALLRSGTPDAAKVAAVLHEQSLVAIRNFHGEVCSLIDGDGPLAMGEGTLIGPVIPARFVVDESSIVPRVLFTHPQGYTSGPRSLDLLETYRTSMLQPQRIPPSALKTIIEGFTRNGVQVTDIAQSPALAALHHVATATVICEQIADRLHSEQPLKQTAEQLLTELTVAARGPMQSRGLNQLGMAPERPLSL